jgi:hypothetical protein
MTPEGLSRIGLPVRRIFAKRKVEQQEGEKQ